MSFWANRAIDAYMLTRGAAHRRRFVSAAKDPARTQARLLATILRENASTTIGRRYGFDAIASFDEYRAKVPVHTFDDLADLVDAQKAGEPALTAEEPVYYARTSGTTGRHKDIPLTRQGLKQIREVQSQLAYSLWRDTQFMRGGILGFAGPVREGRLENGKSYGSTSGSAYRSMSPVLESKFVAPRETFAVKDAQEKYRIYALAVLSRGDVTGAIGANPSSILKVATLIREEGAALLERLQTSDLTPWSPEAAAVAKVVYARADQARVRALRTALAETGALTPDQVWPSLSAIATWTGGSCGTALQPLRALLPDGVRSVEYGYSASEFMGTANVDARANIALPLLRHTVYEFAPRADWEAGAPTFLGLHELEQGAQYYVFATTRSGLYRYHINDIVRATPGVGACPGLAFLQKGKGVTNITGEKLSEHQGGTALTEALDAHGVTAASSLTLADEEGARYVTYVETNGGFDARAFAETLDHRLKAANTEYADKRASGRLGPPVARRWRAGAGETVKAWALERAVREAQYKPVLLDYWRNWADKLAALDHDPAAP